MGKKDELVEKAQRQREEAEAAAKKAIWASAAVLVSQGSQGRVCSCELVRAKTTRDSEESRVQTIRFTPRLHLRQN